MTLQYIRVQLTSYLNEMASSNSYEVRKKAIKLVDTAYYMGLSEAAKSRKDSSAKAGASPIKKRD